MSLQLVRSSSFREMRSTLTPKVFKFCAVEEIALPGNHIVRRHVAWRCRFASDPVCIATATDWPNVGESFAACGSRPQKLAAHSGHGTITFPGPSEQMDVCERLTVYQRSRTMSESAIKGHALHQSLQILSDLLRGERAKTVESSNDQAAIWNLCKLRDTVDMLLTALQKAPSTIVSLHGITQLNNALQQPRNETQHFVNNGNLVHLQNAATHLDNGVLQWSWAIPPLQSELRIADAYRDGKQFQEQVADLRENLDRERKTYRESLNILTNEIEKNKKLVSELSETTAKERNDSITAVAALKAEYSALESELRKRFEQDLSDIAARSTAQQEGLNKAFSEWQDASRSRSDEVLSLLQENQKEAETIVQIVGNIGVTGNYQKVAHSERKAASLWRWITIGFFVASLAVVAWAITTFHGGPDWHLALIRLLAALGLSTPAYYTARESARHRTTADAASRAELELASLGPFIQSLTAEDQAQIRRDLTKAYFGHATKEHEVKEMFTLKDLRRLAEVLDRTPDAAAKK